MSYRDLVVRSWNENSLFSVLVELTYACNLDCSFCYNDLSLRGVNLSTEQYFRLFEDLQQLGVLHLALSGGEPLAHPDFLAIGRRARELGFLVRIKSNGHALRGRMAERIKHEIEPFLVEVSLHGARSESHDRQTRVAGSFDRLVANLQEARALGLRVKLNSTLTAWNENEVDEMLNLADRLEMPLQIDPEVTLRDDGDRSPLEIAASRPGVARMFELLRQRQATATQPATAAVGRNNGDSSPAVSDKHCGAGSSGIAVDPVGNIYPCVQWRRAVGNLHQSSILELWNERHFGELRRLNRDIGARIRAQGRRGQLMAFCPGTAEARTGSALGSYQQAERRADVLLELEGAVNPSLAENPSLSENPSLATPSKRSLKVLQA